MRQHLLGQDNPGGIADLGDLERLVLTDVMTKAHLSATGFLQTYFESVFRI